MPDYVKVRGHQIYSYEWSNNGEACVLLHGGTSQTSHWDYTVLPSVEEDFHVYAYDRAGHGFSADQMESYHLTSHQVSLLEPYYKKSYGVPPLQEDLMMILMDKDIAGFTLAEVNDARKIVAKKQMNRIPELKEKMFARMGSPPFARYVWDTAIAPQLGQNCCPYTPNLLITGVNYFGQIKIIC